MKSDESFPLTLNRLDFAIVTAIDEELKAVRRALGLEQYTEIRGRRYYFGSIGDRLVGCAKGTDRGNLASEGLAADFIDIWKPEYVLLVGIAGGVEGNNAHAPNSWRHKLRQAVSRTQKHQEHRNLYPSGSHNIRRKQ